MKQTIELVAGRCKKCFSDKERPINIPQYSTARAIREVCMMFSGNMEKGLTHPVWGVKPYFPEV